jgi:hypothetical protein
MYYKKDNARFLKVPILFSQHEHWTLTGQKLYFKRVLPLFSRPYIHFQTGAPNIIAIALCFIAIDELTTTVYTYIGSAEKVFRGDRVWGVGCGVWGFNHFEVVNYLFFREKVPEFSPRSLQGQALFDVKKVQKCYPTRFLD